MEQLRLFWCKRKIANSFSRKITGQVSITRTPLYLTPTLELYTPTQICVHTHVWHWYGHLINTTYFFFFAKTKISNAVLSLSFFTVAQPFTTPSIMLHHARVYVIIRTLLVAACLASTGAIASATRQQPVCCCCLLLLPHSYSHPTTMSRFMVQLSSHSRSVDISIGAYLLCHFPSSTKTTLIIIFLLPPSFSSSSTPTTLHTPHIHYTISHCYGYRQDYHSKSI